MRRSNWKTISTLITMAALVGCQDNISAPRLGPVPPASLDMAPAGRPQLDAVADLSVPGLVEGTGNGSGDFTVGPRGGVFRIGTVTVFFPRESICDPRTSGYGISTWKQPCAALEKSISIHAVVTNQNGRPAVDFSPALRFVPSTDPRHWVWIAMSAPLALHATNLSQFNILYAPVMGGPAYDESVQDPTLRTYVDVNTGTLARHVDHFSGYAVAQFASCDASSDPTCTPQ